MTDTAQSGAASAEGEVLQKVRMAVARVERRVRPEDLAPDVSLVDDLHIDSVRLVDLTFALEECVGLEAFPMQEWADAEGQRAGKRFTIGSLVACCRDCLAQRL